MDSSQQPTSTQRRSPTYRDQPYLTYEDLNTRYLPNSPPIRMSQIQRSLSAEDLYRLFQKNQSKNQPTDQKPQGQKQPDNITSSSTPPLRNLETLRRRPPRVSFEQTLRPILNPKLPDPPIFNDTDRSKFEDWKLRIQNELCL